MNYLSWFQILRLGLVQMALGAVLVLTTTTLNRVMVVELAFPATLAGLLFAIYYATQFLRPHFGHGADLGRRRTPWIVGGVVVLAMGGMGATLSVWLMASHAALGIAAAVPAFLAIGVGIGAAGTNLLALLAARVAPERKAAAGSAVWIMMIAGLALTGATVGLKLDPYSPERLLAITGIVCAVAVTLALLGIVGIERGAPPAAQQARGGSFSEALAEIWADSRARRFAIFVFAAMFAYNAQDLILEPFAGHVFGMTPGESTALGSKLHQGALLGMILVLASATWARRILPVPTRGWIVGGCIASGVALIALGFGGQVGSGWPLGANIFILGLANGAFAVAAIAAMMGIASEGSRPQEGLRMGVFGAAQAIAFGIGAFLGTVAVDIARALIGNDAAAYGTVFILEGGVFLISALLALKITVRDAPSADAALMPGE
ncbi:BCD family MFS transporter [Halovulum dunhuangense]|uniref:BCD family MFS transporter n=1 Tax=Halovulum dunhuangense TaxID=1505036 RepID=A0A849L068_9RHOB|nr:BCD family MFS transporter [Halovulum dunhuangense]NNU79360.1 BCD family MFS transporter [Halovulum dunhuangense]